MFEDRYIACAACGEDFMFTADEQEFFSQKGFQDPKKCKPCRQAAKQNRQGGRGGGRQGGGYGGPRRLYDAVCSACGINTQVPFQPNGSKPVYCRDCYQSQASYSY